MGYNVMPASPGRAGHNFVPQPKPSHCPDGHYRCRECNRLLRVGTMCDCGGHEFRKRIVRVSHVDDPIARLVDLGEPEDVEMWREASVCAVCGGEFKQTHGRKSAKCPKCRAKVGWNGRRR